MTIRIHRARALCTGNEFTLYEASRPENVRQHSPAELKRKVQRARNLRDKYQDLYRRQRLQARARTGSKKGNRDDGNARTEQKAVLFAEVLARLEKALAAQEAAAARVAARDKARRERESAKAAAQTRARAKSRTGTKAKPKAKSKAKANAKAKARREPVGARGRTKSAGSASAGFVADAADRADERRRGRNTRSKAIAGHTRAAGKRSQARRDARR